MCLYIIITFSINVEKLQVNVVSVKKVIKQLYTVVSKMDSLIHKLIPDQFLSDLKECFFSVTVTYLNMPIFKSYAFLA